MPSHQDVISLPCLVTCVFTVVLSIASDFKTLSRHYTANSQCPRAQRNRTV